MITKRFPSVDYFRGFILFLLAAESTRVYEYLARVFPNATFVNQFFHAEWQGLHLLDLFQPGFMMIAGSSLYFSTYRKLDGGETYATLWPAVLKRSFLLFVIGVGLYCVHCGELVFELWNVLPQLAVTTIITFFLLQFSIPLQIGASLFLLLISHSAYVFIDIPGFDQAYTPDKNFGSFVDLKLMGKLSEGHWIAMNCIPTAAHTIWGALIGRIIHRTSNPKDIFKTLFGLGLLGVLIGYGLDAAGIPIIKRTATLSFTIVSAGWISMAIALFHANWSSEKPRIRLPNYLNSLGNNSIFIYLFFEAIVPQWLNDSTFVFVGGFAKMIHVPMDWAHLINAFLVLGIVVRVAVFLDQKKVYFKL